MVRFRPPGSKTWYNVGSDAGARAATASEAAKTATPKTVPMVRSGNGVTREQAILANAVYAYGSSSPQAQAARVAVAEAGITPGVIGGIQVLQPIITPTPLTVPKYPHGTPLTTANIHAVNTQLTTPAGLLTTGKRETLLEALKGKSGEIVKYQVQPLQREIRRQNLQLTSADSKLQTQFAQLNMYEQRLNNYSIVNGVFKGSDKEYMQYQKDYQAYVNKFNQVDSSITNYNKLLDNTENKITKLAGAELKAQRAKFGGLAGKYETAERKTAEQLKKEKAEFAKKHPKIVAGSKELYATIKKVTESQVRGPTASGFGTVTKMQDPMQAGLQLDEQNIDALIALSKREGFKGMVQQAGKKPLKTAVMVGVGVATPPVLKGVGKVAKTLGAGRKAALVGKAAMAGVGGMYVVGTGIKYSQAGTPYERGAVLGEAIFQEILPLFVGGYIGTKAITGIPKAKATIVKQASITSRQLKINIKKMAIDERALVDYGKVGLKEKYELPKTKINTEKTYEQFLKEQKINKEVFSKAEYKNLQNSVSQSVRASRAKAAEYKARKEHIIEKQKTKYVKTQTKESIATGKDKTFVKEKSPLSKLEPIEDVLSKYARKQARLDKKFENGQINWKTYIEQSRSIEKDIKATLSFYEKAIIQTKTFELSAAKQAPVEYTKPSAQSKPVTKSKSKTKVKAKSKTKTVLFPKPATKTKGKLVLIPKTIHKVKTPAESVLQAKPKQKPKAIAVIKAKTRSKTKTRQKAAAVNKAAQATKAKTRARAAAKVRALQKPIVAPIIPAIPKIKIQSKKAKKQPGKQIIIYTATDINNHVASLKSLFG